MKKIIEVFGPGCAKCKALKKSAEEAIEKLAWTDVELRYITNMEEYIERGIMSTPALAINGKIIISGKYLASDKLVELLQKY
ncbi:MAG: thioredoxin family protein [Candidatus Hodarchaeota archaeon]